SPCAHANARDARRIAGRALLPAEVTQDGLHSIASTPPVVCPDRHGAGVSEVHQSAAVAHVPVSSFVQRVLHSSGAEIRRDSGEPTWSAPHCSLPSMASRWLRSSLTD